MNWIKWILSFMHWSYWASIATVINTVLITLWAPGAEATSTIGILFGMGYFIAFLLGIFLAGYLLIADNRDLDATMKEIATALQEVVDFFKNWWNSRPSKQGR